MSTWSKIPPVQYRFYNDWVASSVANQSTLLAYLVPYKRYYRPKNTKKYEVERQKYDRKMTIQREATPEQFPDLPFQHPSLYQSGIAPDKKIEVVAAYLVSGNMAGVSDLTGVPMSALVRVKNTEWWEHLYEAMVAERGVQLKARCVKLIDQGLDNLAQRLKDGDQKMGAGGVVVNLAVTARDSAYVVDVMSQQLTKLEAREKKTIDMQAENRVLHQLAAGLTEIAREVRNKEKAPKDVTNESQVITPVDLSKPIKTMAHE